MSRLRQSPTSPLYPQKFINLSRLAGSPLALKVGWELWRQGSFVKAGVGVPQQGVMGVLLGWDLIDQDDAWGWEGVSGDGASLDSTGALVLKADATTTDRTVLRLPLFGTQHLFTQLTLKLATLTSTTPVGSASSTNGTRLGIRHYSEGGGGAYVEALYLYDGTNWRVTILATNGGTPVVVTGGYFGALAIEQFELRVWPSVFGSPNHPSFSAVIAQDWGDSLVRSATVSGAMSGYDFSSDPEQGGYFEIFIDRGLEAGGRGDLSVSVEGLVVDMYPGTGFVQG